MIVNRYPGKCQSCGKPLAAGAGFAYKNGFKWFSVCSSSACHRKLGLKAPVAEAQQIRTLDDSGLITMPYDAAAIPLLRSMPGAKWQPESKQWKVSILPKDLPRVLEVAEQLELDVSDVLKTLAAEGTEESREAMKRAERKRSDGASLFGYQKDGVKFLALHDRAILADDMGLGKSLANGTPVLTPTGWVPIEELVVGDEVIGSDGKICKVTGVFPQGVLPVYDVFFSDGRSVQCSEDHLWSVQTPNDRVRNPDNFRTHTLKEIVETGLEDHNGNRKWFIPVVDPIEHSEKDFAVHPYILGAMLANGSFGGTISHTGLPEQREVLKKLGVSFEHHDYQNKWTNTVHCEELKNALQKYNLRYKNCYSKFIPEDYFWGSVEQRLALLQGLVDNDGTVSKDGMVVEYNTSSSQLADDVIRLVRSLGGVVKFSTRKPKYTYKGEVKVGSTDHRIRIKLPSHLCPVTIPFKKERFVANSKYPPALSIADVIEAGESECTCISVDAEDKLFVTKDYIVTHNTVQSLVALPENARVVLVAPAAVKYNWEDEAKKWRPDYKIHICEGRNSFKLPEPGEIVIVNFEILPDWLKPTKEIAKTRKGKPVLAADLSPEQNAAIQQVTLIVDEAHRAKNYKAARTQKITQIAKIAARVWFLTGTPLMNNPEDLYGVLQAGDMQVLGGWDKFLELFNAVFNGFGYEFGLPSPEVPERMKRVMLRRLKTEVLKDLPPKTYQRVDVPLDSDTIKKLNKFLVEAGMDPKSESLQKQLELSDLPGFESFSKIRALLAQSRIPAMLEMVEEYEESQTPLLVFSAHTAPIEALADRPGWAIITGDTPAEKRFQIQTDFQAGKLKGVGLTVGAGGVGLNLTHASNVLFVDLDWTPALNIQSEDRACRIGQTSDKVLIKRMCSNHPLDLHIQKLLEWKLEMAFRALEASIKFKPLKKRPLVQDIKIVEESDEELAARIKAAENDANREVALGKLQLVASREAVKVNDVPEPPLTPSRKAMLKEALEYMAGRCDGAIEKDGVGFNRPDAAIGHWIHDTGLRDEDELPFRVLERILCRYRRQLKGQFEEIWKPE